MHIEDGNTALYAFWRGQEQSLAAAPVVYIPFMQAIFQTVALSMLELAICLAASTLIFLAVEAVKWLSRQRTQGA